MPYDDQSELPESVRNVLPPHAQDIYKEAHNNALQQYQNPEERRDGKKDDPEEVAHKVAWDAVKSQYEKGDDGNWHPKDKS